MVAAPAGWETITQGCLPFNDRSGGQNLVEADFSHHIYDHT
jgi:hypothetical protein